MITRDTTDKYLSKNEQDKLEIFAGDEIMMEAVKKILLKVVYNGTLEPDKPADPLINFTLSLVSKSGGAKFTDGEIGRDLKIIWGSIDLLESAYEQIKLYKKKELPVKKQDKNIAR